MKKPLQILLISLILHLSLLITNCYSQWVQQTLPVSGLVNDICFINSNTGFVCLNTPAFLRTTNGGTNWSVIGGQLIYHIQFPDTLNGFAHGYYGGSHKMYKTTNNGASWDSMFVGQGAYDDISFVNKDTGWIGGFDQGSNTRVWRTTNGGQNYLLQYTTPGQFIGSIFFAKQRYGSEYHGWYSSSGALFYTTNSGVNWTQYVNLPNSFAGSIFFLNKDTGWVTNFNGMPVVNYTTNNGVNWMVQALPQDWGSGNIQFINSNTGWEGAAFGHVYATTNGGLNWGYQTVPTISQNNVFFLNNTTGWCGYNGLAKTTNGGGSIIYDGIEQISNEIPVSFKLYQNYPNPFNPITNFKIQIPKLSSVKIILYDILGREIKTLLSENLKPGCYKVDFNASELPSGVYIYKLVTDNYMESKKMILVK